MGGSGQSLARFDRQVRAGAASYKNPHGHRRVHLSATDASEMIVLGSDLMKTMDARRPG
jgi:hypothetical protein